MDKRALLKLFEDQMAADLAVLKKSAQAAHEAATHTESKAEDQYDTRGLEASYLAGAQSKRVLELEDLVALYRHVDIKHFTTTDAIASTACVELVSEGKPHHYLMMPLGGGRQAQFDGKTIHVITPQSPMGEALLGKKVGDEVEVSIQRNVKDYEITAVW